MTRRMNCRRFQQKSNALAAAFAALAPAYAWSADSVSTSNGLVTAFLPLVGGVSLLPVGTASATPTADAALGGRLSVRFTGVGRYTGTITSLGDSQTLIAVARATAISGGLISITDGTASTGSALLMQTNSWYATRLLVASGPIAAAVPNQAVVAGRLTTAAGDVFANAKTAGATAGASGSFGQTLVTLGSLGGATFALQGAIAYAAIFNYAMSALQIATAMDYLGGQYGQSIAA